MLSLQRGTGQEVGPTTRPAAFRHPLPKRARGGLGNENDRFILIHETRRNSNSMELTNRNLENAKFGTRGPDAEKPVKTGIAGKGPTAPSPTPPQLIFSWNNGWVSAQ